MVRKLILILLAIAIGMVLGASDVEVFAQLGHNDVIPSIAVSPDGKRLVSCGWDKLIKIWDIETGREIKTLSGHEGWVWSVCYSPDSRHVLSGAADGTMRLWDVTTGHVQRVFYGHTHQVLAVTFTPDGKYALSGSGDETIKMWDVSTGEELKTFAGHHDMVRALAVSPDGRYAVSSGYDKQVIVWDLHNGKQVRVLDEHLDKVECISYSTDGKYFASGDEGGTVIIWDSTTYKRSWTYKHNDRVIVIRFTDNSQTIMSSSWDNSLQFRDMSQSDPAVMIVGYTPPVMIRPDVYILAVGINNYRNNRYNLQYAVADCNGFVQALRVPTSRVFDNIEISTLTDEQATKANIINKLDEIASKLRVEDMFVFYYAGHGIALSEEGGNNGFFLVLYDVRQMTDLAQCRQDGISDRELREKLRLIRANKQMLFIDACNAGAFALNFAARGAAEENALAKLSRSTGINVFASTTSDQLASEFKDLGHGIFTYSLIEAFSGLAVNSDQQITNNTIKSYLDFRVPQLSRQYKGNEQYPTTFMTGQEYPIGLP